MGNFAGTPPFFKCLGNHAFLHSPNKKFLGNIFFRIQGIQLNNLVPMKNCPGGGAR